MNQDEFLKQFGSITDKLAEQSKRVDKSWWGVSSSVERIGRTIEQGWPAAIAKHAKSQEKLIAAFKSLSDYLKDPGAAGDKLVQIDKERLKTATSISALEAKRRSGGITREEVGQLSAMKQQMVVLATQHEQLKKLNALKLESLIYLPAIAGSFKATAGWVEKQQEALKDSNTSLGERIRLMSGIASAQRATGASAETLAEATKAAVNYGLDLKDTYGADLILITKMKEGMGVTVDSSAALVASLKLMGQNADNVANSIATLATNTALAADEATRLAAQLTIAMATMAPGGNVNEVFKVVGGLEGAAKGMGLGSGKVMKMLESLTTTSGLAGAGMIGMQPDEILSSQENATKAFTRIVEVSERMLKAAGPGAGRTQVLDQLVDLFGGDRSLLASSSKVLAKHNEERGKATTLDQKWREQTDSFSKAWDKLKNQLGGIIHSVLMPLVAGAQKVVESVSWLIEQLSKLEVAAWTAGIALGGAGLHSFWKLFGVLERSPTFINAFYKFFPALGKAAGWLGALTPKLAGLGAAGSAMASLIGVLGIGAAGAAGYGIGRLISSITGLDNVMQKAFGGGIKSNIGAFTPTYAPRSLMGQQQWVDYANYMRDIGKDEREVVKWSMDNIRKIKEYQTTDPAYAVWTGQQQRAVIKQWEEGGRARQKQREIQSTTWTADQEEVLINEQNAILKEIRDSQALQTEMTRQGLASVRQENANKRGEEELKRTEEAISRMNLNLLYTPNMPPKSAINFP